jgi:MbtH protein
MNTRAMDETVVDEVRYAVVVNDEDQYSIWEVGRTIPAGWHETGFSGTKEGCLAHVDTVWTDMRPRSLREPPEASA